MRLASFAVGLLVLALASGCAQKQSDPAGSSTGVSWYRTSVTPAPSAEAASTDGAPAPALPEGVVRSPLELASRFEYHYKVVAEALTLADGESQAATFEATMDGAWVAPNRATLNTEAHAGGPTPDRTEAIIIGDQAYVRDQASWRIVPADLAQLSPALLPPVGDAFYRQFNLQDTLLGLPSRLESRDGRPVQHYTFTKEAVSGAGNVSPTTSAFLSSIDALQADVWVDQAQGFLVAFEVEVIGGPNLVDVSGLFGRNDRIDYKYSFAISKLNDPSIEVVAPL